ncbi:MAG: aldo/keto reductase [Trueperaceae bacterium]|nr:MAG: aldo/keto reductase [Trueperaceae bacterium]
MALEYLERVIVGGWQLAEGHARARKEPGPEVLEAYYRAGFRVFDCADIYTGVESLIGSFIGAHGLGSNDIKVHTKTVPDISSLATLTPRDIETSILRSISRLGLERLDLVQFHWWDLGVRRYLDVLHTLSTLRDKGLIREIGLTNFSAGQLEEILAAGIPVASIQTQYSLLDRRPRAQLFETAKRHEVAVLAYGSVAGGLLSERYRGAERPREPHENRSLTKYLLILEEMGGWRALQDMLGGLATIADRRGTDVATIASALCLHDDAVKACIVGVKNTAHLASHLALRDEVTLSEEDRSELEAIRIRYPEIPGAVYALERDRTGPHGRIMKYGLNEGAP